MKVSKILNNIYSAGIRRGTLEENSGLIKGKITELASERTAVTPKIINQLIIGLDKIKTEIEQAINELMNLDEQYLKQYCVYEFTFPNGKKYYGSTIDIKSRWKDGEGYKYQKVGKAIEEYGWNNVKKVIVAKQLTKEEALIIEKDFINTHLTNMEQYGYNGY